MIFETLFGLLLLLPHAIVVFQCFRVNAALGLLMLLFPRIGYPWIIGAHWPRFGPLLIFYAMIGGVLALAVLIGWALDQATP